MWRDHLDAISAQFVVQRIAVVSAITNQVLRLGFDHVEVEAELHQADFVMVCRMRADRKRQSMAIDNRHDFHAFSALRGSDLRAAALGHNEGRVNEAFFFVQYASVAKVVSNIRQYPAQSLVATPSLKAPVHSFVVRIALRQHMPLRAGVENPQHRFKHAPARNRFTTRTSIDNMLLRKMIPDAFPLLVGEPNHSAFISDQQQHYFVQYLRGLEFLIILIGVLWVGVFIVVSGAESAAL